MRWWREFRNPILKCQRLGLCKPRTTTFSGYRLPVGELERRYVAFRESGTVMKCSRCGLELDRNVTESEALDGLTLDTDVYAKLRKNGRVDL